jgi:Uma2 family endonuclease
VNGAVTLEQFLRMPEQKPALEYADGNVAPKFGGDLPHSALMGQLSTAIDNFAHPRRLALAFPELRVTFAGFSFVPDVAVIRWERVPRTPIGEIGDDVTTPPDIAFEITSPDEPIAGVARKCERYIAHGVAIAVMVDVSRRVVRLFQPGQPERVLRGSNAIDLQDVMPGFELTVDEVFAALRAD